MTVRFTFPLCLLLYLFSACAGPGGVQSGTPSFVCKRKGFAIAYAPPAGWTGPAYASGAALDSWTFSTGPAAAPVMLETRIYDAKDSPIRWDTASEAQILAEFRATYQQPRLERLPTVSVDGRATVVRAVHSIGIEELLANVYYGDSLVSVMLTTNDPAELARQRAVFSAFLASLRFEKTP